MLYRVCSEQLQMEPDYNPLFRCSVGLTGRPGLGSDDVWRESGPPAGEVAATFFDAISCQARAAGLPSDEYFTVDRHTLGACELEMAS